MAYELVWEPEGVLVRFTAQLPAREFISSARQMQGDSRFDEARYVINDLTGISAHTITEEALVELSALQYGAYASHPNCRIVFVTTDDELARLIKGVLTAPQMASYQVEVFATVEAARDWLDEQPQLHLMSNVMGFRIR
ncbi:MAG: response regulator transcription factor [Dechloromonas sp.]|nr:MAG: response regulator transcription factor [Dechloromonas sp.]